MLFQVLAIAILIVFYGFYISKIILQHRQSIKTNQMGIGNKPKKVLLIERIMSLATVLAAVIFFALATITMKNSWRVGIPDEKTALVTNGIYRWSRNPAFVGFDLLYLSMCLLFFNIPLLVVSVWAAVMLHLQILQEEDHMRKTFGEDYIAYMKQTFRYLGRR